jgi:Ca2+-binding RTX toxin-like protein
MAKPTVKLFDLINSGSLDIDEDVFIASATKSRILCVDATTLQQVIVEGHNFKYSHGLPEGGTIDKVTLADADGEPFEVLSGFKIDAGQVGGEGMYEFTLHLLQRLVYNGLKYIGTNDDDSLSASVNRDILIGRGGDDTLNPGPGKDVMIGGGGFDIFVFGEGYGKDVIRDFDADGGVGAQDLIDATFADVIDTRQKNGNTILDFGDGDTLTLVGVLPAQIDATDFVV